ncbi:MAG TPA: glycosyltransferase [Candidatus Acidoferrum sp.]|jgi:glycosyltransferase involved in cell wall biosynthesis|nr:glycosyltransferase [Candidatus Acidoferrum sp.]
MKLVVFAHTPPPHHGQSYMVQLLLEGLGGDLRKRGGRDEERGFGIDCYHVNARVSKDLEDVGGVRFSKLFLLFWHCAQAIWCRFRYSAATLYYVPAPGKKASVYRDWLVMGLCRPFFKKVVFHWHASSLAKWLEIAANGRTRGLTYRFLGEADLSIVLSQHNRYNAEKLWPRRIEVVANGIPDPCPEFETQVLPRRQARMAARRRILAGKTPAVREPGDLGADPQTIRVLFLAHCTGEKGLFDAVQAVLKANEQMKAQGSPLSFRLIIAGSFPDPAERKRFEEMLETAPGATAIQHVGFVQGFKKSQALLEADLLCFPSHWENQPVSVIEALAFGLPTVITRLPSVCEMMPAGYRGVAGVAHPEELAAALTELAAYDKFAVLREHFLAHFALGNFCANLSSALRSLEDQSQMAACVK